MLKRTLTAIIMTTIALNTAPALADDDRLYYQNQSQYISHDKAGELAKAHVKGTHVADVEFEHNRRHGAYFEVEVHGNQGEHKVLVDAKTGKIISSRLDLDD